jgi:hypothetical protein
MAISTDGRIEYEKEGGEWVDLGPIEMVKTVTVEIPEEILIILAATPLSIDPIKGESARRVYDWAFDTVGQHHPNLVKKVNAKNREYADAFRALVESV